MRGRRGTGRYSVTSQTGGGHPYIQVGFRLHVDDRELMKLTMRSERVSIQDLFERVATLYLRRDPRIISIVDELRTGQPVDISRYSFSSDEQTKLLDEIGDGPPPEPESNG